MNHIFVNISAALACCVLLSGCGRTAAEEPLVVHSFCGENERFSISNGVIVLSPTEEIFYGGNLEGELPDVVGYSMTFYIQSDHGDVVLLSNSVTDMTGEPIDISGETGKISGDILTAAEIDELRNHLYFKLKTTDSEGVENEYQLQLTLTEITGKSTKPR